MRAVRFFRPWGAGVLRSRGFPRLAPGASFLRPLRELSEWIPVKPLMRNTDHYLQKRTTDP